MSNMTDLVLFDLSQNHLQGTLPTAWASSTSLSYFAVQTNQLTGSIPVTDLAEIYLGVPLLLPLLRHFQIMCIHRQQAAACSPTCRKPLCCHEKRLCAHACRGFARSESAG